MSALGQANDVDMTFTLQQAEAGLAPPQRPLDWAWIMGSYIGAWAGGAAVGYVVGKDQKSLVTGGLAASGVWGLGEAVAYTKEKKPWVLLGFAVLGATSLAVAWRRK
jgi:hypothetical protein